jgi:hypothetical protein
VSKNAQNIKKKRSQSDKIGCLKYNQQLHKQTLSEVEEVKLMLRTIFAGLKDTFNFDQSLIQRVTCKDKIDRQILQLLFEAGSLGLLPKDLAVKLERFKITRHQVSIQRNRTMEQYLRSRWSALHLDVGLDLTPCTFPIQLFFPFILSN